MNRETVATGSGARSGLVSGLLGLTLVLGWSADLLAGQTMMRVTCQGNVLTQNEGSLAGYEDHVEISSVHHEMAVPVSDSLITGKFTAAPVRVVKPLSGSSVELVRVMSKGIPCDEVLIDERVPDPETGMLRLLWRLQLENVLVSERKEWLVGGEAFPPQDSFSFVFRKMQWTFFYANGTNVSYGWDFSLDQEK